MFAILSKQNLIRRPGRTLALMLLSALLCFSIAGGTLAVTGLQRGLHSLQKRLGADIMVVPYEATTKTNLTGMMLQGNPGYFYMDKKIYGQVAEIEGVEQVSAQFYLASAKASCCSARVQLIGFDPETDFTIQPWVKGSYDGDLSDGQVLVGSDINAFPGDAITFYGQDCGVSARLTRTGTYLDTAVFANPNTIRHLMDSARQRRMVDFGGTSPDNLVSCVMVNVKEGYTIENVVNDINLHVRKAEAIQTRNMITEFSDQLSGTADMIGMLVGAVWILALGIMALAFVMISNERRREFAVLRVLGASRRYLAGTVMQEALIVSCLGSVFGAAAALFGIFAFGSAVEISLKMPFLMPGSGGTALLLLLAILLSVAAGSLAALISAFRVSRVDTALILREDR